MTDSYGVVRPEMSEEHAPEWLSDALESLDRMGFAVLADQVRPPLLDELRACLDKLLVAQATRFGGEHALEAIGETGQVRAPCNEEPLFWELATLPAVDRVIERLLGPAAVVLQQNGVVMPPIGRGHQQQRWHRDLPYQRWVSTAPLAIGCLCALDAFSAETGGTAFLPASHRFPEFPSDAFIERWHHVIVAPAGSVVLFDAMTFHRGSLNRSDAPRRAVNTLFGVPLLAQQVTLTPPETASELVKRRSGLAYRPADSADDYRARRVQRVKRVPDVS